ncbi:MAG: DNA-binding protein [Chitinophagaceae bacterium]|nr:MAG: DNA-binding protein [Chitinophagaceae bacterium]
MHLEILTKEDLQAFRVQLLSDLKQLFHLPAQTADKAWLKSAEVRKLLQISPNTLQNLRVTGKLHPTKVGGILYYSREEIENLLRQAVNSR